MTRINLIPPSELNDQHLFSEWREIKMVPKSLARSLIAASNRGETLYQFYGRIPKAFTLNTGHVSFFYDKGEYLRKRYAALTAELKQRGSHAFNEDALFDPDGEFASLDHNFNKDYTPTPEALALIRERIAERVALKPNWYRHTGKK